MKNTEFPFTYKCRKNKDCAFITPPSDVFLPVLKICFLLLLFLPRTFSAQITEYEIKSIFFEKFIDFIEFPEFVGFHNTEEPFVIGVIGNNPFGSKLNNCYSARRIKGKPVVIREISKLQKITSCNLLFISSSETNRINRILSLTQDKPIITVGDTENYGIKGVLINFYFENNHVRFEINFDAVQRSGLYMNYRLLKLAKVINSSENN